jgi:hypothetical protein
MRGLTGEETSKAGNQQRCGQEDTQATQRFSNCAILSAQAGGSGGQVCIDILNEDCIGAAVAHFCVRVTHLPDSSLVVRRLPSPTTQVRPQLVLHTVVPLCSPPFRTGSARSLQVECAHSLRKRTIVRIKYKAQGLRLTSDTQLQSRIGPRA